MVIVGTVLSGLTAFPLETELRWLTGIMGSDARAGAGSGVDVWLVRVRDALIDTNARHPFLAYGTDWLAFGHLTIAVFFIGPFLDPRRNSWIITSGLIACGGVILLAMIAGAVRGIPFYWRLIDCSFGVFCALPLLLVRRWTRQLEDAVASTSSH